MGTAAASRGRQGSAEPAGMTASRRRAGSRRVAPPLEHRILMTAALCLLAFGAVMVYSASSPLGVLSAHGGSGTGEFIRYLVFGVVGLTAMQVLERRGLALLTPQICRLMLLGSFALLLLVLVPGFGVAVNGARRWFSLGPIQFQPSEIMKLALVLYTARYLADHPKRMRSFRQAVAPILLAAGPAILLIVIEPDLGTGLVVAFTVASLMIAAGMPMRYLARLGAVAAVGVVLMVLAQPYQQARLTTFLHPWSATTAAGAGYQAVQGQIALGSGGLLGVGLGKSVQKIYYLPEAQNDFILAVIGEELGVLGICVVVVPVRDDRLRRPAHRAARGGSLPQAAGQRTDVTDPVSGDPQHLRRARLSAVNRRPAAVHLLCAHQPVRDAGVRRAAAQHLPAGGQAPEGRGGAAHRVRRRPRAATPGSPAAARGRREPALRQLTWARQRLARARR